MSVTLFTPQLNERAGPGYPLTATTDLIGPIPQTAIWVVSFFSTTPGANEGPILSQQISAFAGQHTLDFTIGDLSIPLQPQDGVQVNVDTGDTVRMVVQLENNALVLDQTSQNQVWDATGRLYAIEAATTVQGGFTQSDRTELQASQDQTQVRLPVSATPGAELLANLADWFTLSHGTQYVRGPVILLQGRGSLDPTAVGAPWGFGGTFSWFTVPAEIGRDDGLVPVYHPELLQLGIVYADGGLDLYTDRRIGFHTDGHFIEWPMVRVPERIDYWVYPGVVVAWQFMRGSASSSFRSA